MRAHPIAQKLCDAVPVLEVEPIINIGSLGAEVDLVKLKWPNGLERDLGDLELGALDREDADVSKCQLLVLFARNIAV